MQMVWRASVLDSTGYSQAARRQILALDAMGINVKIENVDYYLPKVKLFPDDEKKITALMEKGYDKEYIFLNHSTPNLFKRKQPHLTVGSTYCETSAMIQSYVEKCNEMDIIWAYSRHNLHYMKTSGVNVPIRYIRQSIVTKKNNNLKDQQILTALDQMPSFKFLSIFQWVPRKGHDILLRVFFEEFKKKDDVALIIKTNKMGRSSIEQEMIVKEIEEIKRKFGEHETRAPVYVFTDILTEEQMDTLYQECNAFVLPSRGEALGIPYLEAGSFGLPVIATGWGGQTDFLTDQNSFVVDYQIVPISEKFYTGYYNQGQLWAEPSVDDLKKKMRTVYDDYTMAKKKGLLLKKDIELNYNWEKSAMDIMDSIKDFT